MAPQLALFTKASSRVDSVYKDPRVNDFESSLTYLNERYHKQFREARGRLTGYSEAADKPGATFRVSDQPPGTTS